MSIPVPYTTADIRWTGVVKVREDTGAFLEVIALETRGAVSVIAVSLALIRYGNTHFVSVEGPALGASKADLIVPVPSTAA